MSQYYEHSRSKSSRSLKQEDSRSSKRNSKQNEDPKYSRMESKTPPLPVKRHSMEELINQRETLKMELQKMARHSESGLEKNYKTSKYDKSRKHSNKDYISKHSRKRRSSGHHDPNIEKKKSTNKDKSPDYNDMAHDTQMDSEDEETLIEKRRQERKRLIEKLTMPHQNIQKYKEENTTDKHKNDDSEPKTTKDVTNTQIKTPIKETTDMFAEKDIFDPKSGPDQVTQDNVDKNAQLTDNWDDADGYYNIRVGDEINNNRYIIKSILGQGVFANVVRAQDKTQASDVAIKIVRNNDLMYKTSLKEILMLKQINDADPENKYHCVKFFGHFMHKRHLCLILEPLHMDMRCVIKKYGKHGLNTKALMSYSRQLLMSLRLLRKVGIIHADIKPDNILVNEKKNILKLCDFGSAAKLNENEPTPYLVSRFYRAPEIILGIPYKNSVDVWSSACTIYEMATGKIMFPGSSNNKMLKCFMDLKGKFPPRLIRKGKFKDQHFNYNYNFLLHKKDEFTGREKVVEVCSINTGRDLQKELKKNCKNLTENEEKKVDQLKDLLEKMLMLDANQRLSVTDCLKHPFILKDLLK